MKRKFAILAVVAVAAGLLPAAVGCGEVDGPGAGAGAFSLTVDVPAVKAPDTSELPHEAVVRKLDVFIFSGASLYAHEQFTETTTPAVDNASAVKLGKTYTGVPAGTYTVRVVANGPAALASVTTPAALDAAAITLSDCSTDASKGFVQSGSATVTVGSGTTSPVSVSVARHAARVRLKSVTNAVPSHYGGVTVKAAFLENVYGTWTVGAAASDLSQWVNLAGRKAGSSASSSPSDYITSSGDVNPAAYAAQVFAAVSPSDGAIAGGASRSYGLSLYAFPTTKTADHFGPTTPAEAEAGILPRLVVLATVGGADYYYPVTLFTSGAGLGRNKTYDVSVTLTGIGSPDPNDPPVRGSLVATVTVDGWSAGASYGESI